MHEIATLVGICFLAPLVIAMALSGRWNSRDSWMLSLAAAALLTVNLAAVGMAPSLLPKSGFIDGLQWNWVGKIASILATLLAWWLLPPALKREAGLFALPRPAHWRPVILWAVALILFFWAAAWQLRDPAAPPPTIETLLFQGTLPGLEEEATFRGVFLALLVVAFGKPWRVAGISLGWGALPIIAFFGLAHGFSAAASGVSIDWLLVLLTGVTGFGLLWLKERSGSIWVPVVVHNIINVGAQFIG